LLYPFQALATRRHLTGIHVKSSVKLNCNGNYNCNGKCRCAGLRATSRATVAARATATAPVATRRRPMPHSLSHVDSRGSNRSTARNPQHVVWLEPADRIVRVRLPPGEQLACYPVRRDVNNAEAILFGGLGVAFQRQRA